MLRAMHDEKGEAWGQGDDGARLEGEPSRYQVSKRMEVVSLERSEMSWILQSAHDEQMAVMG